MPDDLDVDREVDRIMALLDVGLDAVKKGDGDVAVMALEEAYASAKRLPPKVICLPDRSGEKPS
ncbi:hypothetical protein [Bradyrhizobium paxllaeri]|uniref:hypothetical protein n=1 Tax=Bradyrhizobium paxllaeri TaxID=190148 RepID=UPI000810DE69|nr:hypothetical protein [Bradyrhizobium paxllaeri]